MRKFVLPIGLVINEENISELPIAETGGEAEKIYTTKPTPSTLYTWFGQVIAISTESIGGVPIAVPFIAQTDKKIIPELVKRIPLLDAGGLLIQIQRECWEDSIKGQRITCKNCGEVLDATVDLYKIKMPNTEDSDKEVVTSFEVKLPRTYTISAPVEQLEKFNEMRFNTIRFRVATLGDAMRQEAVAKAEVMFWQNIAFDTMEALIYAEDAVGDQEAIYEEIPSQYISLRGKKLFSSDFDSKTLRTIRAGMQITLPSANNFYEEDCPECSKPTPFFASQGNFFMV